jgi:hypothetical protein
VMLFVLVLCVVAFFRTLPPPWPKSQPTTCRGHHVFAQVFTPTIVGFVENVRLGNLLRQNFPSNPL